MADRSRGYTGTKTPLCTIDLIKVPIVLTCPPDGTVLDPFSGTGTTNIVAMRMNRQSIGIDMSEEYIELAKERCGVLDE